MSNVPSAWEVVVLVAATYRVWRLVAHDSITDPVRAWLFPARKKAGGDVVHRGEGALTFLQCPWCMGFWLSLGAWGLWMVWPHATVMLAVPWAISCFVGLIPQNLDP